MCRRREVDVAGREARWPSGRSVIAMSSSTIPWTGRRSSPAP